MTAAPDNRAVPAFSALSPRALAMEQDAALIGELAGAVRSLVEAAQLFRESGSGRYCSICSARMDRTHAADCDVGKALAVVERAEGRT